MPDFILMLRAVCRTVYGQTAPTAAYADRAAQLLFMTAAHESDGFQARRQYGFARESLAGAFGLFQMELARINDSVNLLRQRPQLKSRAVKWLGTDPFQNINSLLLKIQEPDGDRIAAVLARLGYYLVPEPIPAGALAQSVYAKRHWNTFLGKAGANDYLAAALNQLWANAAPGEPEHTP